MRFPLATLEDHAGLVTPEMAALALRDPDVFEPGRPEVRMIVPDEDLEEADRLMEEPDVVAV